MQQPDDLTLLRELAERLLGAPFPFFTGEAPRARLFPGSLPADLPLDLPLPPGSRLIGSAVTPRASRPGARPAGEGFEIVLDAPGAGADTLAFYERALTERGWSAPAAPQIERHGGFTPMPMPPSRIFCRSPRGPWLSVRVSPRSTGPSEVRIHLDTATPGPCAAPRGPLGLPPGADLLPALSAPAGVPLDTLGGGGGGTLWHSNAIAWTEQRVAELEAHFGGQLAAAGWTRRDGGVNGPLAWSTWTLATDADWQGLLFVLEEPVPGRRWLHVRAELQTQAGLGGGAGWTSLGPGGWSGTVGPGGP